MEDDQLISLKHEALQLLRFRVAFKRILELEDLNRIGRSDWVDRLHALQAIETDMILRINKFGDKGKKVYSFKNALKKKEVSKPLKAKLNDFYTLIEPLKIRRDKQLAHLEKGIEDGHFAPRYNLDPAIRKIVDIIDELFSKRQEYQWSDGRYKKYEMRSMLDM